MYIERDDREHVTFLKLQGEVGKSETQQLRMDLERLIDEERYNVVLDMGEVKFIGSDTIMTLLRMNREFLGMGGGIKLLKIKNVVKRFLSIGKVLELFDRFETRTDAFRSFRIHGAMEEPLQPKPCQFEDAGRKQRETLIRLIEMLHRKGIIDMEQFDRDVTQSSKLVLHLFRNRLVDPEMDS